jgi:hypothetical protein
VPRIKTRVCASADVCIIARCVARLIVPVHPLVLPRGEEEASWRVSKIDQKGDLRRSSSSIFKSRGTQMDGRMDALAVHARTPLFYL